MDDGRLHEIIEELNREISKDNALVQIHETKAEFVQLVVANKKGYLRLGTEFLRTAIAPVGMAGDNANHVADTLGYLFGSGGDIMLCVSERREDLNPEIRSEPIARKKTLRDRFKSLKAGIWCAIVVLFFAIPWVIGVACMWSAVL